MEFEEVTGKRGGVFYKTVDNHLYRFNKPAKNNKVFLYCYHVRITKDSSVTEKCHATALLDPDAKVILTSKKHHHEPDMQLLKCLKLRNKVLNEAGTSNAPLNNVFKEATRGEEGGDRLSYAQMYK